MNIKGLFSTVLYKNIFSGYSLESSRWDDSNEYPQYKNFMEKYGKLSHWNHQYPPYPLLWIIPQHVSQFIMLNSFNFAWKTTFLCVEAANWYWGSACWKEMDYVRKKFWAIMWIFVNFKIESEDNCGDMCISIQEESFKIESDFLNVESMWWSLENSWKF